MPNCNYNKKEHKENMIAMPTIFPSKKLLKSDIIIKNDISVIPTSI
ncbi:hypothetical protein [Clostridium botulinum]